MITKKAVGCVNSKYLTVFFINFGGIVGGKERMKTIDDVMAKSGKDFITFACSAAGYHCLNNLTSYWLFAYRLQRQMLRSVASFKRVRVSYFRNSRSGSSSSGQGKIFIFRFYAAVFTHGYPIPLSLKSLHPIFVPSFRISPLQRDRRSRYH